MKKIALAAIASLLLATSISVGSVAAASKTHIVQAGDTLYKISNQYKITVTELKRLNSLTSNNIKVKQKLIVENKVNSSQTVSSTNSLGSLSSNKPVTKPNVTTTSQALGQKLVDITQPLLGTPYVWAGSTPSGFDCSGFIYYAFNQADVKVPRLDTIGFFNRSLFIKDPVVGDLLFFQNTYRPGISHIGIYLGDNKFIHAGTKAIEIASLDSSYWNSRFMGFKRFVDVK
ncbi:peptidase [Sporosarcina sp. P21c]|uniref:C40 family peptidase n=1 Tax=unclassified Sporosarcina TaxID=2647733 RepID=UPI000C164B09|nr:MULTISPECIES: LysM peptidoglycan-binding domain-containing C40 family peptidase [unclassified Sporosarcina]PIC68142.1 peptidase [Sporosarcina sp. P16a]PIC89013.1 peptidase [Sporosarcina sp. P21c]PIC94451.1 peptidase [Sporosarcina sp. P25]